MIQLVGCQQTDVKPGMAQPVLVHITNPMTQPKVFCPDCIDLPQIEPRTPTGVVKTRSWQSGKKQVAPAARC